MDNRLQWRLLPPLAILASYLVFFYVQNSTKVCRFHYIFCWFLFYFLVFVYFVWFCFLSIAASSIVIRFLAIFLFNFFSCWTNSFFFFPLNKLNFVSLISMRDGILLFFLFFFEVNSKLESFLEAKLSFMWRILIFFLVHKVTKYRNFFLYIFLVEECQI